MKLQYTHNRSSCELKAYQTVKCTAKLSYNIFTFIYVLTIHGYTTKSQLSVGLIAQSVEHRTGIAEGVGSNSVQA